MNLPKMKIYTGGDEEYSARVQRALFELGVVWIHNRLEKVCNLDQLWLLVGSLEANTLTATDRRDTADRAYIAYRLTPTGKLVPAEADDEGWIAWHGGECPVDHDTEVETWIRAAGHKSPYFGPKPARTIVWCHDLRGSDIIAYRVPSQIYQTSQVKERDMKEQTSCEQSTPTDPRDPEFWRLYAPEGATHWGEPYRSYVEGWYSKARAGTWFWLPAENANYGINVWNGPISYPHHPEDLLFPRPEPEQPEWDGQGLPPVGTVCEAKSISGEWFKVEVIKLGDGIISGRHEAACMDAETGQLRWCQHFRPVRTERERVIDEAIDAAGPYLGGVSETLCIFHALYDAGMLHLPGSDYG
jgi:hypothetical protein